MTPFLTTFIIKFNDLLSQLIIWTVTKQRVSHLIPSLNIKTQY